MIKILNQYKIYNEVHTIENSPHSFWFFQPWFDQTVDFTTNFLNIKPDKVLKICRVGLTLAIISP